MSPVHILVLMIPAGLLAGMFLFILGRRAWRARTFRRLDRWREHWLSKLPEMLEGGMPARPPSKEAREARETLETLLVDRMQAASAEDRERFSVLIERSGLLDSRIHMLRYGLRWDRLYSAAILGRMHSEAAVPALLEALEDSWPAMRNIAIRSLRMIGSPAAGPALLNLLRRGVRVEPSVWVEAAVACVSDAEALVRLIAELEPAERRLAARALSELKAPARFEFLEPLVCDPDPEVRAQAARALSQTHDARALPLLIAAANDAEWFVRLRAIGGLAELGEPAGLSAVLAATRDHEFRVRQKAAAALAGLVTQPTQVLNQLLMSGDRYALEGFLSELARAGLLWRTLPLLRDSQAEVRGNARQLLMTAVARGNHQEVMYAVEAHPDWRVRMAAARLLAQAGNSSLRPEIEKRMAAAPSERLRRVWSAVLRNLGSPPKEKSRALALTF